MEMLIVVGFMMVMVPSTAIAIEAIKIRKQSEKTNALLDEFLRRK